MSTSAGKNLPPEITEAILRRLPAKSLGRFKSVSKKWYSLISNPNFIKTHLLHLHTKKLLLGSNTSLYSIHMNQLLQSHPNRDVVPVTGKKLSFPSPPITWVEFLGSCNGLVLAKDETDSIFVMNPTTQALWKVPICPFKLPHDDERFFLVRNYFVMYGFGYDSSTDDYKVVSVSFWNPESGRERACKDTFVRVYSLGNNSWRELGDSRYDHTACYALSGALVNEKYHWLVNRTTIVAFSFAEEEFKEVKLSGSFKKAGGFGDVVDIGGKLGVMICVDAGYELWVMEEYGVCKSWTCRACVNGFRNPVRPVCLVEGSDREIVFDDLGRVVVYNTEERRCRSVRVVDGPSRFPVGQAGMCYVESLESPKPHSLSSRLAALAIAPQSSGVVSNVCSKSKLKGSI